MIDRGQHQALVREAQPVDAECQPELRQVGDIDERAIVETAIFWRESFRAMPDPLSRRIGQCAYDNRISLHLAYLDGAEETARKLFRPGNMWHGQRVVGTGLAGFNEGQRDCDTLFATLQALHRAAGKAARIALSDHLESDWLAGLDRTQELRVQDMDHAIGRDRLLPGPQRKGHGMAAEAAAGASRPAGSLELARSGFGDLQHPDESRWGAHGETRFSSARATTARWTSSGPSENRRLRASVHIIASGRNATSLQSRRTGSRCR